MSVTLATEANSRSVPSSWLSRGRVFALVAAYFLLQTLLRVFVSDSAELDESEQLIFTQSWAWGYGAEPPLYSWLQMLVFQIFGISILGLALLKNVLLLSACLFTYLAALEISRDARTALLAMLSLFLFPQITWESQRDLTHSVLATALAAATFFAAVRTWKSGKALDYCFLGLCLGLGALSKDSYWLLVLAMGTAALSIPVLRRALLKREILLSITVFILVSAAHFYRFVSSQDLALTRSKELLDSTTGGLVQSRVLGLISLLKCAFMLGGGLSLAYLFCFRQAFPAVPMAQADKPVQQWIWRTLLVAGAIALAITLVTGIELRDRWFQPLVFLGAISAALLVRDRTTPVSEQRFCRLIGLVGGIVLIVLPGIPLAASVTHRPTRLNAPYTALSQQLKSSIAQPDVIVAATRLVGGNLRFSFPQSLIVCPEFTSVPLPAGGRWLVAWDATKSAPPPARLLELVKELRGGSVDFNPAYLEAPFKFTNVKRMKLGYFVLPSL